MSFSITKNYKKRNVNPKLTTQVELVENELGELVYKKVSKEDSQKSLKRTANSSSGMSISSPSSSHLEDFY